MTDGPQRIPDHVLAEIRIRNPLSPIVGRRVRLERAAGGLMCGCCPFHGEKRPSFYLYPDHYHCYGCGEHGDVINYVMKTEGIDFLTAVQQLAGGAAIDLSKPAPAVPEPAAQVGSGEDDEKAQRKRDYAKAIWLAGHERLAGSPVADYLAGRGIDLAELGRQPRALRCHPGLWHPWARRQMPAMVAVITGAGGEHLATHCTWLERIGAAGWIRARMEGGRLVFGRYPGGSIHLWRGESGRSFKDALADEPVVIGEGIETCLSIVVACPELRVIAGVNKAGMGKVWLPPQVRVVILAADNDETKALHEEAAAVTEEAKIAAEKKRIAGRRVLQRAIDRHLALGRHVRIARAPVGKDFNDTLQDVA